MARDRAADEPIATFRRVLFFIDESWQTVGGRKVGSFGAVAISEERYNDFCAACIAMKQDVLGAEELMQSEIKGQNCFSRASFKRRRLHGGSEMLDAAERLFEILAEAGAHTFIVWTTNPDLVTLRSTHTTALSKPYKWLLYNFWAMMRQGAPNQLGSLNFDLRGTSLDEATACTIQNFMIRTEPDWESHFICVPNFTVSSVSPGLQAADVVAYLGTRLADRDDRPELQPYVDKVKDLAFVYRNGKKQKRRRTIQRAT
jgi:hypothetical protein